MKAWAHFFLEFVFLFGIPCLAQNTHTSASATPTRPVDDNSECRRYLIGKSTVFPPPRGIRDPSPNFTRFLVQSVDDARLIDATTGEMITKVPYTGDVPLGTFSPDGTKARISDSSTTAQVVRASDGKRLFPLNESGAKIELAEFSPDSRRLALPLKDGRIRILDAETGTVLGTIPGDAEAMKISFSPDSSQLVILTSTLRVKVAGLEAGLVTLSPHEYAPQSTQFSVDGSKLILRGASEVASVFDLKSHRDVYRFHRGKNIGFSKDGSRFFVDDGRLVDLVDTATGENIGTVRQGGARNVFSPDGSLLAIRDDSLLFHGDGGDTSIMDSKTGNILARIPNQSSLAKQFSPDNTKFVSTKKNGVVVRDSRSGQLLLSVEHEQQVGDAAFSPDNSLLASRAENSVKVIDAKNGETIFNLSEASSISFVRFASDGSSLLTITRDYITQRTELKSICVVPERIELPAETIDLQTSQAKQFCAQEGTALFKQSSWISSDRQKAPLVTRLWEWQKPGGMTLEKDLPALVAILKNPKFCERNPELILGVLENILPLSDVLYEELLRDYPHLKELRRKEEFSCRTKRESELLLSAAEKKVQSAVVRYHNLKGSPKNYESIKPLSGLLSLLSPDKKQAYLTELTLPVVYSVVDRPEGAGLFESQVHKLVKQRISPLFGLSAKPLTDLSLVRTKDGVKVVALGTHSTNSAGSIDEPNDGISIRTIAHIKLDDIRQAGPSFNRKFEWSHDGKNWSAMVTMRIDPEKNLISDAKTLPYEEMEKDGFRGMVMAGATLSSPRANLDQYRKVYISEGYNFHVAEDVDCKSYLLEQIASGKLDYFAKEAHSDGDRQNLFKFYSKAKIYRGVKTRADGGEDVVDVLYPDTNSVPVLLSNAEFGAAIRKRSSPLVYFNTSCWSVNKAINESPLAGKYLLNIVSNSVNEALREDNSSGFMWQAFLRRKNNAELHEALDKDKTHAREKINQFWFPGEVAYRANVGALVETPVISSYSLTDPEGNTVTLEDQEAH